MVRTRQGTCIEGITKVSSLIIDTYPVLVHRGPYYLTILVYVRVCMLIKSSSCLAVLFNKTINNVFFCLKRDEEEEGMIWNVTIHEKDAVCGSVGFLKKE